MEKTGDRLKAQGTRHKAGKLGGRKRQGVGHSAKGIGPKAKESVAPRWNRQGFFIPQGELQAKGTMNEAIPRLTRA